MKNIKMTLFKKIFFTVFVGFLCIVFMQVYINYNDSISEYVNNCIQDNIKYGLADFGNKFEDKEDWTLKEIENEFISYLNNEDTSMPYGYYRLSYNGVGSTQYYRHTFISAKTVINVLSDEYAYRYYSVVLDQYGEDVIRQIDKSIENSYLNNERVTVELAGNLDNEDYTYIKINDIVVLDGDNSNSFMFSLKCNYRSATVDYSQFEDNEAYFINYSQLSQRCEELLKDKKDFKHLSIDYDISYKKEYDGTYIMYEREGSKYHLTYMIRDDLSFLGTLANSFYQNLDMLKYSLIISFLISLFISYQLTQRIYKIEKKTRQISDNNFDIILDEKPNDELGDLSKSINKMSHQLKDTIQQLNQEIEHVKELESLRKDFINQFTHEMKTPLGIINGYSELIEESDNEEEKEKYLTIINRETERINMLIQSMLKLSRLEAGKVELSKEEVDLEDIITEVVDEYEVLLMKKNIKVEVIVRDKHIIGDRIQLMTVLRNFLSNAIKHTDTVIVITADKGISVYNEGKPIDEERLESIWYTFVTHDKSGTGLGLAICRSILELHGYRYGVINRDNGVEFYFFE